MLDKLSNEYIKIRSRALKYVLYKKRTVFELRCKLKELQCADDITEDIINDFIKEEYLNDELYIQRFINTNNKLSLKVLANKLRDKGISREMTEKYTENLEELEEGKIILLLNKKKFSKLMDFSEQNKIKLFCMRKGFEISKIEKVIKKYESEEDDYNNE